MKKLAFDELVSNSFLNEKELKKVTKLAEKDESIKKLVDIHNAFQDKILNQVLITLVRRIDFVRNNIKEVEEWLDDGQTISVVVGRDDEGSPLSKEFEKKIGVLMDKQNGIAERTRDMTKELSGITEDALLIIGSKRRLLGDANTTDEEIGLGVKRSWTDLQGVKNSH